MGARENKVETYLTEQIEAIGGITRKWVCPGVDGVPDRIVIHRGRVIFVEVKSTDGTLSPAQSREHERLLSHGAWVTTVHGEYDIDQFVKELCIRPEVFY